MDTLAESKKARRKGDSSLALGVVMLLLGLGLAGWGLSAPFYENRTAGTVWGFILAGLGVFEIAYGWHYRQRAEKLENLALNPAPAALAAPSSPLAWPPAPPNPTAPSAFCSSCGTALGARAAFCAGCGSAVLPDHEKLPADGMRR